MAISIEVKAKAMAMLLEGHNAVYVSKTLGISYPTVRRWQMEDPELSAAASMRIGEMVINNLEESLNATSAIAKHAMDKEWLMKQSAQELAVLFGVLTDKSIRVLEAMSTNANMKQPKLADGETVDGEVKE